MVIKVVIPGQLSSIKKELLNFCSSLQKFDSFVFLKFTYIPGYYTSYTNKGDKTTAHKSPLKKSEYITDKHV